GNFIWSRGIGNFGYDSGFSIEIDDENNIYTTGSFEDTVNFGLGHEDYYLTVSHGIYNAYLLKIKEQTLSTNENNLIELIMYPNPTTGVVHIEVPAGVLVSGVVVTDVAGRQFAVSVSGNRVDMSRLSAG